MSIPVPASLSPLDVSSQVLPPALPPACPVRQLCEPPRPKSQKKVAKVWGFCQGDYDELLIQYLQIEMIK